MNEQGQGLHAFSGDQDDWTVQDGAIGSPKFILQNIFKGQVRPPRSRQCGMGPGQDVDATFDRPCEPLHSVPTAKADEPLHQRQRVHRAVVDLAQKSMFRDAQAISAVPLGDLPLGSKIVPEPPLVVAHRAEVDGVPKRGAVLAVVEELDIDGLLARQAFADAPHGLRRGFCALHEPAVPPDHLSRFEACEIEEGLVGEHDGPVGLQGVCNHHGHAGPLDRDQGEVLPVRQHVAMGRDRRVDPQFIASRHRLASYQATSGWTNEGWPAWFKRLR
jgi:hypothetical protein